MSRPILSTETWETLLRKGGVRPLRAPKRTVPSIDALDEFVRVKLNCGLTLIRPLPDKAAEEADQLCRAIVHDDGENYVADDPHPGVAIALAAALAVEAKHPRQGTLFGANGHHAEDDEAIVVPWVELEALPAGPRALAEVAG